MPWRCGHGISQSFDRGEGAARPGSRALLGTHPITATVISEFFINLYHYTLSVKGQIASHHWNRAANGKRGLDGRSAILPRLTMDPPHEARPIPR